MGPPQFQTFTSYFKYNYSSSPQSFCKLRAKRPICGSHAITYGPWDMGPLWKSISVHIVLERNTFCYGLQGCGSIRGRPCAYLVVHSYGVWCYLFVYSKFPYVVKELARLHVRVVLGKYQEEVYIHFFLRAVYSCITKNIQLITSKKSEYACADLVRPCVRTGVRPRIPDF